ncbi:MAG: hypothetical protein IT350_12555 [Deltaproteobacteria bacterium]|nr:hypothetical protein [Deltaproteobacteria bacterium]
MKDNDRRDHLMRFLNTLHGRTSGLVEIRHIPKGGGPAARSAFATIIEEAAQNALEWDDEGLNVYVGVGRRSRKSGTASDTPLLGAAWIDADGIVGMDELESVVPPPTIILETSPGRHAAYWVLTEPRASTDVVALNRAMVAAIGGDPNACDAARVMKLPGVRNRKPDYGDDTWANLVLCDDWRRHRFETLAVRFGLPPAAVDSADQEFDAAALNEFDEERAAIIESDARQQPAEDPAPAAPSTHMGNGEGRERPAGHHRLLEAVVANCPTSHPTWNRERDRVSLNCLFHDDAHPSAVVFGDSGRYRCSSCGINEPPWTWSRRPEVSAWAAELVPSPAREPRPDGFHVPHLLLPILRALAPHPSKTLVTPYADATRVGLRFGTNQIYCLSVPSADLPPDVDTTDPSAVRTHLARNLGGSGVRTLLAILALAQQAADGGCHATPTAIARLLRGRDEHWRPSADELRPISLAMRFLAQVEFTAKIQRAGRCRDEAAPLVSSPDGRDGRRRVHPALWADVTCHRYWFDVGHGALRLGDDDALRFCLEVLARRWRTPAGGDLRLSISATARDAGAWNVQRYSSKPGSTRSLWYRRIGDLRFRGVFTEIELSDDLLVVR